jgi:hypothetical protein
MAGTVAEAGATEKAAQILKIGRVTRSRSCVGVLAGRTHAHNPLPRPRFAA